MIRSVDAPRIVLRELERRPGTTRELAQRSNRTEQEVLAQLRAMNERLRAVLAYDEDPIIADADGSWRADGVAGLVRFDTDIEVEIVPKFLSPVSSTWRSDFFLISVLAASGHVLTSEEISAAVGDREDLATLITRALIQMHQQNRRNRIRRYRRRTTFDYSADGDVDWESIWDPNHDGFNTSRIELSKQNPYNATLRQALLILRHELADSDTEALADHIIRGIGPQEQIGSEIPPLPPRFADWDAAYELSKLVVTGFGLDLRGGTFSGPGFIVSTWAVWQSLCEVVLHQALPSRRIVGQLRWPLGRRGEDIVYARPDISVLYASGAEYVLDAKYKTRLGRTPSIQSADLYESLAFMRAADTKYIGLLYPSSRSIVDFPLGTCSVFDSVIVDEHHVDGIEIQIQGLAMRGGLNTLIDGVRATLGDRARQVLSDELAEESGPVTGREPD